MDVSDSDSEIEQAWAVGCASVIPEKSKERYNKAFEMFKKYFTNKKCDNITEKVLIAYFVQRNEVLKSPGSLWAEYSMLKATIFLYHAVDISKFKTLIAFLKRKNAGYKTKKSRVFTRENMEMFLMQFPDQEYLNVKVGMILGIAGACRRDELYNMTIGDVTDNDTFITINLPNTKTNISRTFTIVPHKDQEVDYLKIIRNYIQLRGNTAKQPNLFFGMRNGKIHNQVVGRNTIGSWPSKIAKCLNLSEPNLYTGHAFRRSSATLLANKGVDILGLKRHAGWRSSSVAEGYVENSVQNKNEFAKKILHSETTYEASNIPSTSSDQVHIEIPEQHNIIPQISNEVSENVATSANIAKSAQYSNSVMEKNMTGNNPVTLNNCTNCTFNLIINNK